jgi:hypothetical protein
LSTHYSFLEARVFKIQNFKHINEFGVFTNFDKNFLSLHELWQSLESSWTLIESRVVMNFDNIWSPHELWQNLECLWISTKFGLHELIEFVITCDVLDTHIDWSPLSFVDKWLLQWTFVVFVVTCNLQDF